ncbi:Uncharacterised protein [Vibrio cholerae]|nr:Uncharacterised protein [Vibrio cholerae]
MERTLSIMSFEKYKLPLKRHCRTSFCTAFKFCST